MAIQKILFEHTHYSRGDEDWYYLAHDTKVNRLFVQHRIEHEGIELERHMTRDYELAHFLAGSGRAEDKLRDLIATLIRDKE